jgi:alpha 1,2-mannosyltransferase
MVKTHRRRFLEAASIVCIIASIRKLIIHINHLYVYNANNIFVTTSKWQMNETNLETFTRSTVSRGVGYRNFSYYASCRDDNHHISTIESASSSSSRSDHGDIKSNRMLPHVLSTQNNNDTTNATLYKCHSSNAIVYMVQKGKHSSYERNSTALFLKSLDLLYRNYLSMDRHYDNVDVFLFHTGDYTQEDLDWLQNRYHHHVFFRLMNLQDTDYWSLPEVVQHDNISEWQDYPVYSIGYRHMIRWYALKLYDFMRDWNAAHGCSYRYVMRMDEESFIHSPIAYDLFQFMERHQYSYAFRMCSYELNLAAWYDYQEYLQRCRTNHHNATVFRVLEPGLCGFYNNFFILDLHFVWQPHVQHFLSWMDDSGMIYRQRYNDLQIQTIAVYAFCPPTRIHRFLDWSYEHMTVKPKGKMKIQNTESDGRTTTIVISINCPHWGAIQAGYLDPDMNGTISLFEKESNMLLKRCHKPRRVRVNQFLEASDLSPTYAHYFVDKEEETLIPSFVITDAAMPSNKSNHLHNNLIRLRTISAGPVELPDRGLLSG